MAGAQAVTNKQTLDEAARALHELYLAYIKAGFTQSQALELCKAILQRESPPEPGEVF